MHNNTIKYIQCRTAKIDIKKTKFKTTDGLRITADKLNLRLYQGRLSYRVGWLEGCEVGGYQGVKIRMSLTAAT